VQRLQVFLFEATWDSEAINTQHREALLAALPGAGETPASKTTALLAASAEPRALVADPGTLARTPPPVELAALLGALNAGHGINLRLSQTTDNLQTGQKSESRNHPKVARQRA